MGDVVVVGSCNLDLVVQVRRHPRPGETVLGTGHFENPGGKGANQAVAAARLGAAVAMVGRVGDDDAGRQLRDALTADGVDVSAVTTSTRPSGIALITVDEAGENAIVVSPGANDDVDGAAVDAHRELLTDAAVCLLQLEIPDAGVTAAARAAGGTVILNPAPARPLDDALLAATTILVPNASELAWLADADEAVDIDAAAAQARSLALHGAVVVTLGANGACVVHDDTVTHVAAPQVDAVDTTAAGDAFCGALADALARDAELVEAVRWATAAGACATLRSGAQRSLPDRAAVTAMLGDDPG
ncbi:ribokinase [soil metagenome]